MRALPTARAAITVRVPAKVNLYLGCGPLRGDGFHELVTVYHALSLFDDVTVAPADALSVTVRGEGATDVPLGAENLAARAAQLVAERAGVPPNVAITLTKGIPVAGGMAGGSADAAGALLACDALWHAGLGRDELGRLAARLGSDVPFALQGGTALGTGRGERLTPVLARGTYHWVVALAAGGLSTPVVYAELDRLRQRPGSVPPLTPRADGVLSALRTGTPAALAVAMANDLQAAALSLRPELARTLQAGRELGALAALVSGSGPTCLFLVRDAEAATGLAAALTAEGVCRSVRRATGPVAGARMLTAPER